MKNKKIEIKTDSSVEKKVIFHPKKLEILIYGVKADDAKIKKMSASLQKQIDKHSKDVRGLFYVDNGEMSVVDKKAWLIKESCCKYFIFAPDSYNIPDNYVAALLAKIKEAEFRLHSLKDAGIVRKSQPKSETSEEVQETAKIVSIAPNQAEKAE